MPRRPKCRFIEAMPNVFYFKPHRVPMRLLEEVILPVEGFEALRLVEIEGLDQGQASAQMKVSRQTFGRILAAARKTLAQAVVLGMALRIEGGHFEVSESNKNKTEDQSEWQSLTENENSKQGRTNDRKTTTNKSSAGSSSK
ncbi:MAG: DUF134 domain-containing protein [Deltaproteobacteria bacterium]|nr:DUF134 domain-containing protein [Deltaproteobacteria bacterium]MBW2052305.1 DUF134 domain-containing protein [Deltaproteobacteria bacterium]MBW2139761.1 DUF134 domain-containing protein [Deltaproteobacteria bacterium]MBW2323006.1 DUF134 domain-containing protein [Deltaproteobacteria bacterium]